jgi:hypothetical protein
VSNQATGSPAPQQNESGRTRRFFETLQGRIVALTGVAAGLGILWATIQQFIPKNEPSKSPSTEAAASIQSPTPDSSSSDDTFLDQEAKVLEKKYFAADSLGDALSGLSQEEALKIINKAAMIRYPGEDSAEREKFIDTAFKAYIARINAKE